LRNHGFAPDLALLELAELESAIASNPYPEADSNPKSLHLVFLVSAPATSNLAALESARSASEHLSLAGRVLYFWAPEGVGRSKLFARTEKLLGVAGTARNWRTACAILNLAREVAATGRGESAPSGTRRKRNPGQSRQKRLEALVSRRHQGSLSKA
ncbi:MAG: DUF1697 domain-containing protein, partial [Pedosphaera parvula]|nr:DUF1697 domain-containing protein [Pedosphaera parvula]